MKWRSTLLLLTLLVGACITNIQAQAPYQFNYQAAIRDGSGQPLPNRTVKMRLRIRNGVNGAAQYSEERTVTTNPFGMVSIAVGSPGAQLQQGNISLITWDNGDKYLQVEVDLANNGAFTDMGTTQLLSVPYAVRAAGARPVGTAAGDLGGNYPNPTVNKIQGEPLDLSAVKYHGYTLKWDQVNNKWSTGKDEDGGPDFYFKAARQDNEIIQFANAPNLPSIFIFCTQDGIYGYPYQNTLRFKHTESDQYGVFDDSVFTAPVNGYYEFEVKVWFAKWPKSPQTPMKPPIGWVWLGAAKNDTTMLTFTMERYETENESHVKPIQLKRTCLLQAGDRVKFKLAHDSDYPVQLGYTKSDVVYRYEHLNWETMTVSGRRLR